MADVYLFSDAVLLTVVVRGALSSDDILSIVFDEYPKFSGRCILWDLSHADIRRLTAEDLHDIALATRTVERRVQNVKTAFVTVGPSSLAFLNRYVAEAARVGVPTRYAAFSSVDEAKKWLVRD